MPNNCYWSGEECFVIWCVYYTRYCTTTSMMNGSNNITNQKPEINSTRSFCVFSGVCVCASEYWVNTCMCVYGGGRRTAALKADRLENRFPQNADMYTKTLLFLSVITHQSELAVLLCYLCSNRDWWPAKSQGLLGGSACGKQWSWSSEEERCTFELSLGKWQSCKAQETPLFFLCDLCFVSSECTGGFHTLMWDLLSLLTVAAINGFSNCSLGPPWGLLRVIGGSQTKWKRV